MKVAVCALDEHSQKLEGGELVTTRGYRALSGGHETLPPTLVFFYSLLLEAQLRLLRQDINGGGSPPLKTNEGRNCAIKPP